MLNSIKAFLHNRKEEKEQVELIRRFVKRNLTAEKVLALHYGMLEQQNEPMHKFNRRKPTCK